MPTVTFERTYEDATKLYYEFIDSLLVIPGICSDLRGVNLENCIRKELTQIIVDFRSRYQLKQSISGTQLDVFLQKAIKRISNTLREEESYQDFPRFKTVFLRETSLFAEAFRESYKINKMEVIDELETEIGFQILKLKDFQLKSKLNFSFIDELDRKMYELFLKIKSKFNKFSPVNQDSKVMIIIGETVKALVSKYMSDNNLVGNEDLENLQGKVEAIIMSWLKSHSIHYLINSHPLNMFAGTQELRSDSREIDKSWQKSNLKTSEMDLGLESDYAVNNDFKN